MRRLASWLALIVGMPALAGSSNYSAALSSEMRGFPTAPSQPAQARAAFSAAILPKYSLDWENRRQIFETALFFRYDQADSRRTHFDIADLSYVKAWDGAELRAGVRKVFWGVTESQHLVDIINQTDLVEDYSGHAKLGQPMVNPALITDAGNFELFIMPFFRERTFPGANGHFRPAAIVNTNNVTFQSEHGRFNPDAAFRWTHHLGIFDVGASHFYGTNREPKLLANGGELFPYYAIMEQTGLDAQMTLGPFIGKMEMIARGDKEYSNHFFAGTWGGEYTLNRVAHPLLDIGLLVEYLYDSRGRAAPQAYSDHIFGGVRATVNESGNLNCLLGSIWSRTSNNQMFTAEASRRFGNEWKLALKGGLFHVTTTQANPLAPFARDDFFQIELTRYFLK